MGVNKAQIKSPSGLLKLGALVRHDFFFKCRLFWELYLYLFIVFLLGRICKLRISFSPCFYAGGGGDMPRYGTKEKGIWTWAEKKTLKHISIPPSVFF